MYRPERFPRAGPVISVFVLTGLMIVTTTNALLPEFEKQQKLAEAKKAAETKASSDDADVGVGKHFKTNEVTTSSGWRWSSSRFWRSILTEDAAANDQAKESAMSSDMSTKQSQP